MRSAGRKTRAMSSSDEWVIPDCLRPFEGHLSEFPLPDYIPNVVVYFLLKNNEVVYVGQTTDLPLRIGTHLQYKEFDRLLYVEVNVDDRHLNDTGRVHRYWRKDCRVYLNQLERAFVKLCKPRLNKENFCKLPLDEYELKVLKKMDVLNLIAGCVEKDKA